MTDDHPMGALSPTCKPDDDADAGIAGPLIETTRYRTFA
jgi:hypothetical protein